MEDWGSINSTQKSCLSSVMEISQTQLFHFILNSVGDERDSWRRSPVCQPATGRMNLVTFNLLHREVVKIN